MLSGKLFPFHPKPLPDELLSSWIIRTAHGHGQGPYSFCKTIWPAEYAWNRDIDNLAPNTVIKTMSQRTATSLKVAQKTTLKSLEGELMEFHFPNGRTKWILRGGIYHRIRKNPWLQFCPHCLASDPSPYFRKRWRLALVATCTQHGNQLVDRCPQCNDPIMPHRTREIFRCHACNFDLREAPTSPAYFPALVLQQKCEAMLQFGWGGWEETLFLRSILFFDLLHQIFRVLSTGSRSKGLRDFVDNRWGGDASPPKFPAGNREFESLGTADRHRIMGLAAHVLEGWPWRYVGACAETNVWFSWAVKDGKSLPYAYTEPVKRFL